MPEKKNISNDTTATAKETKKEKKGFKIPEGMHKAIPIILAAAAVFTAVSFIVGEVGAFGSFLSDFLMGLFAKGAYAVPVLLAIHALFYLSDVSEKRVLSRVIFSLIAITALSAMIYGIQNKGNEAEFMGFGYYTMGLDGVGGGFIGSLVGYALSALFGYVGVIIISVAVFAIYITYFFSKGNKTIRKAVYVSFKAIITVCDFVERKIKSFIKSRRDAKNKKMTRKLNEKSRELSDDEFFDVDNGIESLKISELGISETRSRESLESRPSLHNKVHHKSEYFTDEPVVIKDKNTYYEADYTESPKKVKKVFGDYSEELGFTAEEADIFKDEEPTPEKSFAASTDASADSVFTKGFDPFSLAHSEELANKPSSKAAEENKSTYSESISELTEEDVARARRVAAFERRKAEIVGNAKRAAEAANAANEKKTVEFKENAPAKEPEIKEDESSFTVRIEKTDNAPCSADYAKETSTERGYSYSFNKPEASQARQDVKTAPVYDAYAYSTPKYDDTPVSAPVREEPVASFSTSYANEEPKREYPAVEFNTPVANTAPVCEEPVANFSASYVNEEPKREYPTVELNTPVANTAPVREEPVASFSTSYVNEESKREYPTVEFTAQAVKEEEKPQGEENVTNYYAKTEDERPEPMTFEFKEYTFEDEDSDKEKKSGLIFEVEGEFKEPPIEEGPKTITIERTKLNSDVPSEDETEEDDEYEEDEELTEDITPDDEQSDEEPEEIPPEKQNPKILEYRDMFKMYRDEEKDESPKDEPEDAPAEKEDYQEPEESDAYGEAEIIEDEAVEEEPLPFERDIPPVQKRASEEVKPKPEARPEPEANTPKKPDYSNYQFPPIELLGLDEVQNDDEISKEIEQNTNTLIETLASFNVTASIKGVDRGPRVTRYEVVPARGVKVNAITNLFDNIALNLAAEGIRMEAPIPGKSAIGFEIPNKRSSNVRLRELLECEEFVNAKSKTFVCIGKDVGGNPVFGDIAKFPHALVAGATGMGKSVCINSIMISLLFKARPDEVKFIMIDPKKVEFRMYSGIPHLLIPVITEAKQAAGALMWAVEEMERRYGIIEQLNIKNIESYNEKCAEDKSLGEPMPKIVIVIDELNDLMMQVRDPVEDLIMRIAQKARAAGIHLIIGTQRPDVKVVTGTIKANINTRISCKVTSVVDSRTILEMAGAEKLLNRGDMLFKPVDKTKPIRVQGCFVSDPEVEAIMNFLKAETSGNIYDDEVYAEINRAAQKCGNKKSQGSFDDDSDDGENEVGYYGDQQFLDAVELAIRSGKVSTSLLQRKLSIGYGKAAKFIDAMEDIGIVSEQNGQKPRDILLSMDEWHEKLSRVSFDD